jgi:hypothetical protein
MSTSDSLGCTNTDDRWNRLKSLVLDSVSASSSRRLYAMALDF